MLPERWDGEASSCVSDWRPTQVMKEFPRQEKQVGLPSASTLVAGEDYYSEGAVIVFTARYLLRGGYCCESGCRHSPYRNVTASDTSPISQVKEEKKQRRFAGNAFHRELHCT